MIVIVGLGPDHVFRAVGRGAEGVARGERGEASGIINVTRYVSAALVISVGTILFVRVGSDELNESLAKVDVGELLVERLDQVLTGAPTSVTETEATLKTKPDDAFRQGAARGIAEGFAAFMLAIGIICLLAMAAWLVLMRPARAP